MKLKMIEAPKEEKWVSKSDLSSILTDGEMGSITGGFEQCGKVRTCAKTGKNHCIVYSCDKVKGNTVCGERNWGFTPIELEATV